MLIKIDFQKGLQQAKDTIGAVSSVYRNLSPLASSPKVPIILGQAAARTIDRQNYVPLVKAYAKRKLNNVSCIPMLHMLTFSYNNLRSRGHYISRLQVESTKL